MAKVLEVLSGCPDGATLDTLRRVGCADRDILAALDAGAISETLETLRHGQQRWRLRLVRK
jgi:hypothetical protein